MDNLITVDQDQEVDIPVRDWQAIIDHYNTYSKTPYRLSAMKCSRIVERVRGGLIPKIVFEELGINYKSFQDGFNRCVEILEDLNSKNILTDEEAFTFNLYLKHPAYILGSDIKRCMAFHWNERQDDLLRLSRTSPTAMKEYMKLVRPEMFIEEDKVQSLNIQIKIGSNSKETI